MLNLVGFCLLILSIDYTTCAEQSKKLHVSYNNRNDSNFPTISFESGKSGISCKTLKDNATFKINSFTVFRTPTRVKLIEKIKCLWEKDVQACYYNKSSSYCTNGAYCGQATPGTCDSCDLPPLEALVVLECTASGPLGKYRTIEILYKRVDDGHEEHWLYHHGSGSGINFVSLSATFSTENGPIVSENLQVHINETTVFTCYVPQILAGKLRSKLFVTLNRTNENVTVPIDSLGYDCDSLDSVKVAYAGYQCIFLPPGNVISVSCNLNILDLSSNFSSTRFIEFNKTRNLQTFEEIEAPVIERTASVVTVTKDMSLPEHLIICQVFADPMPTIRWSFVNYEGKTETFLTSDANQMHSSTQLLWKEEYIPALGDRTNILRRRITSALKFPPVSSYNTTFPYGRYKCVASNFLGKASKDIRLIDKEIEPIRIAEDQDKSKVVVLNRTIDEFELKCTVLGGPVLAIKWEFSATNWSELPIPEEKYNKFYDPISSTIKLKKLEQVTTLDEVLNWPIDNITCKVFSFENSSIETARLTYIVRLVASTPEPSDTQGHAHTKNIYWTVGDKNQSLKCTFRGLPVPQINWLYNGQSLNDVRISTVNLENHVRMSTLYRSSVGVEHDGKYVCAATNIFGAYHQTFYLHVENESMITAIGIGVGTAIILIIAFTSIIVFYRRKYLKAQTMIRSLTEDEIKEFHEGVRSRNTTSSGSVYDLGEQPFDPKFEIQLKDLNIDDKTPILGKGAFGMVLKSEYHGTQVAVKTIKRDANIDHLKALLTEIKIMAYLGEQPNVVKFIGAVSTKLHEGSAYTIVEFSKLGDLESNLRKLRGQLLTNSSKRQSANILVSSSAFKKQALLWSLNIANGMKSLAEKRVIHGDLAARNVLLFDDGKVAKITDFGLSRKLCQYDNYVKKSKTPLPWRWMALEALKYFDFSSKSDVWSFGVTVWEIFTCAEIPYPTRQCNKEFVDDIQQGLRLQKPPLMDDDLYTVILECWSENPRRRINFNQLVAFLSDKLGKKVKA